MKHLFIIQLCLLSLYCNGQNKVFNTKIEKANKVVISGGKAEIKNVENLTIGTIILLETKAKYYFSELIRERDSSGIFKTKIILKHDGHPDYIYVDFKIQFSKPVLSVTTEGYATGMNIAESFENNNSLYFYRGMTMSIDNTMIINITSNNDLVSFAISGVEPKQD